MENLDEANFLAFVKGLESLSKQYGIVLSVTGGVYFVDKDSKKLQALEYTKDHTSGDLDPMEGNRSFFSS